MENQPDPTSPNKQEESTQQESNMEKIFLNKNNNLLRKESQASKRNQYGHKVAYLVEQSWPEGMIVREREMERQYKKLFDTLKYTERGILGNDSIGVKLSEVETQPIEWLWRGRIPFGKITILDGDPGVGKSLLALTIAACVSTGRPMPDSTLAAYHVEVER